MSLSMAYSLPSSSAKSSPSSSSYSHPLSQASLTVPRRVKQTFALRFRNQSLVGRAMKLSDVGEGSSSLQVSKKVRRSSNAGAGPRMALPDIPTWAIWALLGSAVCLAIPSYKKILRIEGGVEKVTETIIEGVEKVAEVVEKVATDIANALPDSNLKQEILEVEKIAELVDKDAEIADAFIHKVDEITDEIEALVEPTIEMAKQIEKETQDRDNKESDPSSSSRSN